MSKKDPKARKLKAVGSDSEPPDSDDIPRDPNAYRVEIPSFEGPLDLLLHLIQKHELDILDIPIGFITKKYVEYITLMQGLSIDLASEYLVMAATLALIKSRSLLPPSPMEDEDEDEYEADPRAELVRRLLEYQKYKLASEQLGARGVTGRDVFVRGQSVDATTGPADLAQLSIFKLLDAFQRVLTHSDQTQDHKIGVEQISISERINQLSDVLHSKRRVRFDELFGTMRTRGQLIVTFLALLEMTRLRLTRVTQDGSYAPIFIELSVQDGESQAAEPGETIEPGAATASGETTEPGPDRISTPDDAGETTSGGTAVTTAPDLGNEAETLPADLAAAAEKARTEGTANAGDTEAVSVGANAGGSEGAVDAVSVSDGESTSDGKAGPEGAKEAENVGGTETTSEAATESNADGTQTEDNSASNAPETPTSGAGSGD